MKKRRKKIPDVQVPRIQVHGLSHLQLPDIPPPPPLETMQTEDYLLARRIDLIAETNPRRRLLGRADPRVCRFCRRAAPEVTFQKEAHIIPQSLGNGSWLTLEECDACNQDFGLRLEDHLVKFLAPMRVSWAVPAKSETYSHQIRRAGSRIDANASQRAAFFNLKSEDDSIKWDLDEETRHVRLQIRSQPLSLYRVLQALGVMAIRALPVHLISTFEHVRRWVTTDARWPVLAVFSLQPGTTIGAPNLGVFVLRKPLVTMPMGLIIFSYWNLILACHTPTAVGSMPTRLPFPKLPCTGFAPFAPAFQFTWVDRDEIASITLKQSIKYEQLITTPHSAAPGEDPPK